MVKQQRHQQPSQEDKGQQDDGCGLQLPATKSCFTCPFEDCMLGSRHHDGNQRDQEIRDLFHKGMGIEELAAKYHISERSVYRIIGSHKPTKPTPRG